MAISRQKEARSRDYVLFLFRMTSRVLYSAQYYRQHFTLHAFEQFGALYMHNQDDKYPARPGFEPGTCRLQAPVDTNEPSGPAWRFMWYTEVFKRQTTFQHLLLFDFYGSVVVAVVVAVVVVDVGVVAFIVPGATTFNYRCL